MSYSFDPKTQEKDLTSKLVVGLERFSEVFRVLLWEKAKESGLSPIQIQILLFLRFHDQSMANVSTLSIEFNMKKPTISDAVKALFAKGLIEKEVAEDARAYTILLSKEGMSLTDSLQAFDNPLRDAIGSLDQTEKAALHSALAKTIFNLNQNGILQQQRMCFGCRFYESKSDQHYCHYIKKELREHEIRLDCNEYQSLT